MISLKNFLQDNLRAFFFAIIRSVRRWVKAPAADDALYFKGKELVLKDHEHHQYYRRGDVVYYAETIGGESDFALKDHSHPYVSIYDVETESIGTVYKIDDAELLNGSAADAFARMPHHHPTKLAVFDADDAAFSYKANIWAGTGHIVMNLDTMQYFLVPEPVLSLDETPSGIVVAHPTQIALYDPATWNQIASVALQAVDVIYDGGYIYASTVTGLYKLDTSLATISSIAASEGRFVKDTALYLIATDGLYTPTGKVFDGAVTAVAADAYVAVGQTLYKVDASFNTTASMDFDAPITELVAITNGVVVFTQEGICVVDADLEGRVCAKRPANITGVKPDKRLLRSGAKLLTLKTTDIDTFTDIYDPANILQALDTTFTMKKLFKAQYIKRADEHAHVTSIYALKDHQHPEYVKRGDAAYAAYALYVPAQNGYEQLTPSDLAPADHTHSEYVCGAPYYTKDVHIEYGKIRNKSIAVYVETITPASVYTSYVFNLTVADAIKYLPQNIVPSTNTLTPALNAYFYRYAKDAFAAFNTDPMTIYMSYEAGAVDLIAQIIALIAGVDTSTVTRSVTIAAHRKHFSYFVQHVIVPAQAEMAFHIPGAPMDENTFREFTELFNDLYGAVEAYVAELKGEEPGDLTWRPLYLFGSGVVPGKGYVTLTTGGFPASFIALG